MTTRCRCSPGVSCRLPLFPLVIAALLAVDSGALADPSDQDDELHFSHPLITESPSPDTKLRFDYLFAERSGEEDGVQHTLRIEGEYAFARWLSFEADIPYTFVDPADGSSTDHLDTVEVGLKYANFSFAEHGLLIGGGIAFGLPTGDDSRGIGSDHVLEVEPFIDFGYRKGRLETVGLLSFGIPTNENGEDAADVELGWDLSFLYRLAPGISTLLEFNGEQVIGGDEDGETIVTVTPSIKVTPLKEHDFQIGLGYSLPISDDKEFDIRPVISLFYHF